MHARAAHARQGAVESAVGEGTTDALAPLVDALTRDAGFL